MNEFLCFTIFVSCIYVLAYLPFFILLLFSQIRPTVDMASMLQNATVALKLLPNEACPGLVLVTDGTGSLPENSNAYDNLFMLMNREDISCSAIQAGSGYYPFANFGFVPDPDALSHFVWTTSGALLRAEDFSSGEGPLVPIGLDSAEHDVKCHPVQLALMCRSGSIFFIDNP